MAAVAAALAAVLPFALDAGVPAVLPRAVDPAEPDPDALAAGVEEAPADDNAPLIWAWIVALKVPLMPVRLFEPL